MERAGDMRWLPDDWETVRASGWWEIHHLIHTPCGYRTTNAFDLVLDLEYGGRRDAREVVFSPECDT